MDEPAAGRAAKDCCDFYRSTCGIPAGVHPELGRIVVRAGIVGAITMPAALGALVRDAMLHHQHTLGPIIEHPRSARWTFLVRPGPSAEDMVVFAELLRLNVSVAPIGSEIALPSTDDDDNHGYRKWVVAPLDSFRPSGAVILSFVRACSRRMVHASGAGHRPQMPPNQGAQ